MPVDLEEFLQGLSILADNQNLRVTVQQSGKGAAICGAMCFIGGLIGGPAGLAIGGTLGGVTAYRMTSSKFNVKRNTNRSKINHKSIQINYSMVFNV